MSRRHDVVHDHLPHDDPDRYVSPLSWQSKGRLDASASQLQGEIFVEDLQHDNGCLREQA